MLSARGHVAIGGIPEMFANAAANAEHYRARAGFGLGALWRTARIALGYGWNAQDGVLLLLQRVSQAIGLFFLLSGVRRRDLFLAVGGFLLATPNTMYYGMLYLLPTLWLVKFSRWETCALFAMICPLQLALPGGGMWLSANGAIANALLFVLLAARLVARRL